jgi:hypothetical protein
LNESLFVRSESEAESSVRGEAAGVRKPLQQCLVDVEQQSGKTMSPNIYRAM